MTVNTLPRVIDRDKLDDLIESIIFAKRTRALPLRNLMRGHHAFDLSQIDDIDMSDLLLTDRGSSDRMMLLEALDESESEFVGDASAIWPINISWLHETEPDQIGQEHPELGINLGKYRIYSVRTTSIKEAKRFKNIRRISTKMIEFMNVELTNEGSYAPFRVVLSWIGGKWLDAHAFDKPGYGSGVFDGVNEIGRIHIPVSFSLALTRRYEWSVSIGMDNSPKLTFTSDPAGLRSMFSDRDKPADKNRRTPLRHWVSEHWRKKRSCPEDRAFVLQHLRGATPFKWYGYDCVLRPSPYDLELNEKIKNSRRIG